MSEQLFDIDVSPAGAVGRQRGERPSADRRRTERRQVAISRGQHPTGNGPIDRTHKCGECRHCVWRGDERRRYYKCDASYLGTSSSAASDIRISWPSCPKFMPKDSR